MFSEKDIEYVLHLKTIMPDIILTGHNKEVYDWFIKNQEEEYNKIMKDVKKVKQVRKDINPELETTIKNETEQASDKELDQILHDLQDSESDQ